MEFFEKTGKMALGSRLRLLSAKMTEDAAKIYDLYEVEFSPKWFPVFFVLSENEEYTITEIAEQIGHSQPSVTIIIKEMTKAGLVKKNLKSKDKRRNVVGLTEKGQELAYKIIKVQCADIEVAVERILEEATHNLWEAVAEWEYLLEEKSLIKRVQEQKKLRESKDVIIIEYSAQYKDAFRALNEEWLTTYFEIEESDHKTLNDPEEYIIKKGGKILVALYNDECIGVCALIKMEDPDYDYEMAKMAVSPKAQGKSVGFLLAKRVIKEAIDLGASKLFLESNTILKPAINLYQKLGFRKITGRPSPYKRSNIQMELDLKDSN